MNVLHRVTHLTNEDMMLIMFITHCTTNLLHYFSVNCV